MFSFPDLVDCVIVVIPYIIHFLFVLLILYLLRSLLLGGDKSTKKEAEMQRIYQEHRRLNFLRTRDMIEEILTGTSVKQPGQRRTDKEKAHQVCNRLFGLQLSFEDGGFDPNKLRKDE